MSSDGKTARKIKKIRRSFGFYIPWEPDSLQKTQGSFYIEFESFKFVNYFGGMDFQKLELFSGSPGGSLSCLILNTLIFDFILGPLPISFWPHCQPL